MPAKRFDEISSGNVAALAAIAAGNTDPTANPYFGYYPVDIFDCPPFVMFTNNDCPSAACILYLRKFEMGSMSLWCRLAKSATAIIDIGANVGVFSLAAAALRKDIPIHAFEPNPYAFARLRVHKYLNQFTNISEHAVALGRLVGQTGIVWLKKPNGWISSGAGINSQGFDPEVKESALSLATTLDSVALGDVGTRCLIKMDVEGYERKVFQGMASVLGRRPNIIVETFDQESCDAINQMTAPLGYRYFLIHEDTGEMEPQEALLPRRKDRADFNQFLTTDLATASA